MKIKKLYFLLFLVGFFLFAQKNTSLVFAKIDHCLEIKGTFTADGSWPGGSIQVACAGDQNGDSGCRGEIKSVSPGEQFTLEKCSCPPYVKGCLEVGQNLSLDASSENGGIYNIGGGVNQAPEGCNYQFGGNDLYCGSNDDDRPNANFSAVCAAPTPVCQDVEEKDFCLPDTKICPPGQGITAMIDSCGKTKETQGCHDIPECRASLPTNTPAVPTSTPRPTVTPLPTITTGPGTPTPTPIPTVPTSTPTPIGPTPTGPRPSVTLTPTPTPTRPANTPTPTIAFDKNACACDGLDTPGVFIGTPTTFTAYSKLVGTSANIGMQKFITFYMYKQDQAKPNETGQLIGGPADVNSVLVSNTSSPTRYRSQWLFTDTSKLEKGVTYMVYADTKKGCVQKQTAYNFETPTQVVLAAETQEISFFDKIQGFITRLLSGFSSNNQTDQPTPTPTLVANTPTPTPNKSGNIQLIPFYPANILQKSCQVLRFQLPS